VTDKPIAIVTGVGPGTGSAIVRRFAGGGFRVIALARSPDRIRALEQELPDTHAVVCDVSTGNTSAIRGKANFAGFAPTKAAQRILSESIARDLGPRGIHVAYLLIDAVIDVPRMRERLPEAPDEFFIKPSAIADELWHLYNQDRSAWSFLTELRPFGEKW
jgi:NAD(P)-dependent dehydrogenase (short-subunit alcohol dehydrogenase family)